MFFRNFFTSFGRVEIKKDGRGAVPIKCTQLCHRLCIRVYLCFPAQPVRRTSAFFIFPAHLPLDLLPERKQSLIRGIIIRLKVVGESFTAEGRPDRRNDHINIQQI